MGVHLYAHKLSYFSVPKCACTSLKTFFFEVENGEPFRPFRANGKLRHIHNAAYGSKPFEREAHPEMADHWKAAIVRDPVDRVVSAYANRVLGHRCLAGIALTEEDREKGLTECPDLPTFARHLWRYRKLSRDVEHHVAALTHFLGRDASYYDALYPMSGVGQFVEDVAARIGPVPALQRMQTSGGQKVGREQLGPRVIAKIERMYAADYETYGHVFAARPQTVAAPAGA
ncbi:MAG: sulfotransferase family 2 domain-containing protein [Pseudomonadota bacterium]